MPMRSPCDPMRRKTVYVNGVPVGSAPTWHEVAALLTKLLQRSISSREAQKMGSEGPDGFYVITRQ
jgi:hypothetical protein